MSSNIAVTIVGKAVKVRHCPATVTEDESHKPLFLFRIRNGKAVSRMIPKSGDRMVKETEINLRGEGLVVVKPILM